MSAPSEGSALLEHLGHIGFVGTIMHQEEGLDLECAIHDGNNGRNVLASGEPDLDVRRLRHGRHAAILSNLLRPWSAGVAAGDGASLRKSSGCPTQVVVARMGPSRFCHTEEGFSPTKNPFRLHTNCSKKSWRLLYTQPAPMPIRHVAIRWGRQPIEARFRTCVHQ